MMWKDWLGLEDGDNNNTHVTTLYDPMLDGFVVNAKLTFDLISHESSALHLPTRMLCMCVMIVS